LSEWSKVARQMLLPGGAVLLAAMLAVRLGAPGLASRQVLEVAFAAVGLAVVVLAWRFQMPRIALATLLFWIAGYGVGLASRLALSNAACLLALLTFAIPANLALLLLVDESTFDLESFGWWAGLIVVEGFIVCLLSAWAAESTNAILQSPVFGITGYAAALLRPTVLAALFSACALAWDCASTRKSSEVGLFWATVAAAVALAAQPQARAFYFVIAILLLGMGVLETSYSVAFHDELTGLPGRRAYNRMIAGLGGEYSIAVVDIDHFKKFNDTYGHDIGDEVLRMVAAKLAEVTGGGRSFRCGGEEFSVVFPHLDMDSAYEHVELLRQEIASTPFSVRGPDRSNRPRAERRRAFNPKRSQPNSATATVTVSIGLAEPKPSATPAEVIKWADKALYEAKGQGRNQVVRHVARKRNSSRTGSGRSNVVDAPTPTTPFR